jgi:hypothetical protein
MEKIEKEIGIPVTEVISEEGKNKMLRTVLNYFDGRKANGN